MAVIKTTHSPIVKCQTPIIVYAGGEQGFVDSALLIFKFSKKTRDYHQDMNYSNYKKWLKDKLIPNLPPNSVVIYNASYHNVQLDPATTSASTKAEMQMAAVMKHSIQDSNETMN
jgi:hypothetical protein